VVARGTLPGQHTVSAPLGEIAAAVAEADLRPPAITVIGPAAGLRDTLSWLERRPLHGKVVAVTRARAQASELAVRLRELGAEVVEAPAIRIEPRTVSPDALEAVAHAGVLCFTSPNGVRLLFAALREERLDARSITAHTVAAIGPGTATELLLHGVMADVTPERSVAEELVKALADTPMEGERVVIARASQARDVLPDALRDRGAEVDVIPLYDTVAEPLSEEASEGLARAHYVTFTSSSTVRFFLDQGGAVPEDARVVSIGPVTSETAREHGLAVDVEAERHDIDGLIEALVEDAR
jgi:uroporphyrinogen III methyltransferase/synthase